MKLKGNMVTRRNILMDVENVWAQPYPVFLAVWHSVYLT